MRRRITSKTPLPDENHLTPMGRSTRKRLDSLTKQRVTNDILDLYVEEGLSIYQIASQLNMSPKTVSKYLNQGIQASSGHTVDRVLQVIEQHADSLDEIITAFMPLAKAGDYKSAQVIINAQARQAALLGLDRPVQIDQKVTFEIVDKYQPDLRQDPNIINVTPDDNSENDQD